MTNRIPLIVDASTQTLKELPVGDRVDLDQTGIANLAVANLQIFGGNSGQFLQTDGNGVVSWATVDATKIQNGDTKVDIPVNNGDIELWVAGNWVGNISLYESNVTGNFTAGGNVSGGNLTTGGGVSAFDATLTDLYVNGIANLSDVSNVHIFGGASGEVLSTDGTGNLSWTSSIANANYAAYAANVTEANQPNITSLGTLTGLTVNGDATVTGNLNVSGNLTYIDVTNLRIQDPVIQLGGGANGAPLTSDDGKDRGVYLHKFDTGANAEIDKFMGWDSSAGEFAFGSNVTLANDVVTFNEYGNVHAAYFIGNGSALIDINGSNVTGVVANANYAAFAGTVTNATQSNITSVGTLTGLTMGGNILPTPSTTQYLGNFGNQWAWVMTQSLGSSNSNLTLSSYGPNVGASNVGRSVFIYADGGGLQSGVNGGDILLSTATVDVGSGNSGNINLETGYVDSGTRGAVNIAADHLYVMNPMTVSGVSNLGAVGNVTITGGSAGQFLQTNGSGVLTWANVPVADSIANGTSNVSIPVADGPVLISVDGSANIAKFGQSDILFSDGATTAFSFDLGARTMSVIDGANAAVTTSVGAGTISVISGSDFTTQILSNSISTQDDTNVDVPYSVMTPGFVSVAYGSNNAPVLPTNPEHLTPKAYVDSRVLPVATRSSGIINVTLA